MKKATPTVSTFAQEWHHEVRGPDTKLSCVLAFCIGIGASASFVHNVYCMFYYGPGMALPWLAVTNDVTGMFVHVGALFLWAAMVFGDMHSKEASLTVKHASILHTGLSTPILFGQTFLPFGFAPNLFAFGLGVVMFLTSNLVKPMEVKGADFYPELPKPPFKWTPDYGCRANDVEIDDKAEWLTRFKRGKPSGCVGAEMGQSSYFFDKPAKSLPNLVHPYNQTCNPVPTGQASTSALDAVMWRCDTAHVHVNVEGGRHCVYQCAGWLALTMQNIITKSGSIFAGATVLAKTLSFITTKFGSFVDKDTDADELVDIIELTLNTEKRTGLSRHFLTFRRTISLVFLAGSGFAIDVLTPRIDKDGFYTVDYYVTEVFLFALLFSMTLRYYCLYSLCPVAHTPDLWGKGCDTFLSIDSKDRIKIDLYEWYHITPSMRAEYLMNFAREVTASKSYQPQLAAPKKEANRQDATPAQNPLKERLLDMERRLDALSPTKKAATQASAVPVTSHIQTHGLILGCFHGLHDKLHAKKKPKPEDPEKIKYFGKGKTETIEVLDQNMNPLFLRVSIKPGAMGICLGRTENCGEAMVEWEMGKYVSVEWPNNGCQVTAPVPDLKTVRMAADMAHCEEKGDVDDDNCFDKIKAMIRQAKVVEENEGFS